MGNEKPGKPAGTRYINTSAARDSLSNTLNRVSSGKERIVIRRHGKEIAALVSMEDLAFLEKQKDRLDLREAIAAFEEAELEGTVFWDEVKKGLDL